MFEEVGELCGPKYHPDSTGDYRRAGSEQGETFQVRSNKFCGLTRIRAKIMRTVELNLLRSIPFIFLLLQSVLLSADEIEKVSLHPATDMQWADLFVWKGFSHPEAALVLCPGCNGSGEGLIHQPVWQRFAKKHKLGLVGLSFASDTLLLMNGRGYYYASKGSGDLLLDGIRKIYGKRIPLLLYGISGGAHFTARFVEWKPDQVVAWCAYSAGWWDEPKQAKKNPPGIIACGDYDERYGASLIYFKQGRALGKSWLWVSLPQTGHGYSGVLEDFVRKYFAAVLNEKPGEGQWVDVDLRKMVSPEEADRNRSVTGWLPDARLDEDWRKIHEP